MKHLLLVILSLFVMVTAGCSTFNTASGNGNFVGKDAVSVYGMNVAQEMCRDAAGNRTPCSMLASTTTGSSTVSVMNGGYYGQGYMNGGGGYVNGIPASAYSSNPYQPVRRVQYVPTPAVESPQPPPAQTRETRAEPDTESVSRIEFNNLVRQQNTDRAKQDRFEDTTVRTVKALNRKIDEK